MFSNFVNLAQKHVEIDGTVYDTAWLARIPSENNSRVSRFPKALEWLINAQHSDGSWGSKINYSPDRILSTLAALITLHSFKTSYKVIHAIENGIRYLWQSGYQLEYTPVDPVGFELLLPTLVEEAQRLNIHIPSCLSIYETQRIEKLKLIPSEKLYSPYITTCHSLEFLGKQADFAKLKQAQAENGSLGNSPAATAYFYLYTQDEKALTYLQNLASYSKDQTVPVLYPCEDFEILWAAYHLYLAGLSVNRIFNEQQLIKLKASLSRGGISLSPSFPIPDADDTAVALLLLQQAGYEVDASILNFFLIKDGYFASFPYEKNASVGVNLHVLHALLYLTDYPNRASTLKRLVDYILNQQISNAYWFDKWHASPYYATSHALCILSDLPPELLKEVEPALTSSFEWLRQTQNEDGSWGFYGLPTLEETAYGILALTRGCSHSLNQDDQLRCKKALRFITENYHQQSQDKRPYFPPLWIDKCLYTPTALVQVIIDSSLSAVKNTWYNLAQV
jgi:halimadienyl-diphosphate synthase